MDLRPRTISVPGLAHGKDLDFDVLEGDTVIGPAIESGAWEEHETALFRAHLRPGDRVVDLGANVGWYAVLAILAGCEVHAFEPVPAIAAVAERNMRRAEELGPGKGVLHAAAAGAETGTAQIALAPANHGDNRVVDGGEAPDDLSGAELTEIRVERVDDHVQGPIRLLKVDTQGSEWLALQGAKKLLKQSPELALLIEFWPYALRGASPEDLLALLTAEGFVLGKATAAPYPMRPERILRQALARDPVKGGIDLYGTRGLPFHVGGTAGRLRSMWRSLKEG
ncbi:MAG: FkbM family methyltransferase [Planctomycetota bacterium]